MDKSKSGLGKIVRWCFLWLVLPCFIFQAALVPKSRKNIASPFATEHAGVTLAEYHASEEDEEISLIQYLLQEYLEVLKVLPKAKKSKFTLNYNFKYSALDEADFFKGCFQAPLLYFPRVSAVFYKPQNFFLSDYYTFLFRLTPF